MRKTTLTTGVAAFAAGAAGFVARYVPITNRALLATAALAPYLMLGAPLSTIIFAMLRRWSAAGLAALLTAATAGVQLPRYVSTTVKATDSVGVRIMSANLRYGRADPDALVRLARQHADILAVQELTPDLSSRLSAAGLDDTFPFRALRDREGPAGVGIWSRYPISRSDVDESFWLGLLTAHVRIPDVKAETTVVVTHLAAPWPNPLSGWRADLARLSVTLQEIAAAADDDPVMLAGDLNATPDIREFRRVLRDGYHDAAEQAGAGLTRTHPADIWLPPLLALDHILIRGCTATAVRTMSVPGSDHRAIVADVEIPRPA
jgi:endonuclease/exonuclease/phosphatase (EEP) superfamily protein YafD